MSSRFARILLLPAFVALVSCKPSELPESEPVQKEIIIIHTGRLLGNVFPLSLAGRDIAPLQYYHMIAGYVDSVRREAAARGATLFLIDSGDGLQGSFASNVTNSANMVEFYNRLDYDAVILGNLDALVTPEMTQELRPKILVPFVNADGQPGFQGAVTHTVLEKNGIRLALIANFHGDLAFDEKPDRFPSYYEGRIDHLVFPLRDYDRILAEIRQQNPDYIVFNWFKFESPQQTPPLVISLVNGGVNVILAHRIYSRSQARVDAWGSTSYDWPVVVSENTQRANNGYVLARVDLGVTKDGRVIATHPPRRVTMDANTLAEVGAAPDQAFAAAMEKFAPQILQSNAVLAALQQSADETQILGLYLASLIERDTGAVAVYSTQSIRAPWPSGPLTTARVYEAVPWTTPTVRVRLTPEQFAKIRDNPNLRFLGTPQNPEAPAIVTSAFFSTMFKRDFQLADGAITVVNTTPETQLFSEWIKNNADKIPALLAKAQTNQLASNHENSTP